MGLSSRRLTRGVLVGLALLGVAAAIEGAHLWRQQRWNAVIAAGAQAAAPNQDARDEPPQVRFARAYALAEAGGGDAAQDEQALRLYRGLEGDSPLGRSARFNGANLLMRQAVVVQAGSEPGKAIALIELAKEGYRNVLREEPLHWGARYNLERAQRLLPDPEELDAPPPEVQRNAERAATTMRGYSPGLP